MMANKSAKMNGFVVGRLGNIVGKGLNAVNQYFPPISDLHFFC